MTEIITQTTQRDDQSLIATVTVSNPQRLNCLDSTTARALAAAFKQLAGESTLRAVRLQGAGGRAFIGGADIREMATLSSDSARDFIDTLHQACDSIRNLPVPVIAQISGYCLGAGLEIAASCDFRIADNSASFAMPEVRIGLPSVIEAALLPRLIGWGRTARLVYTGESIDADTACRWGLVEQLTTPEALPGAVDAALESIARADPAAIRMQKQLLCDWASLPLDEAITNSIEMFPRAFDSDQARQRMQAFLDRKRG